MIKVLFICHKKSAGAIRHLELCGIALTLFALRLFGKILVGQYAVHGRVYHAFVADIRLTERTLIFQAAFYHDLAGIRVAGVVLRFDPVGFHLLE